MSRKPRASASSMLTTYASDPVRFLGNSPSPIYDPQYGHNIPMFTKTMIPAMLRDGRVRFGLQMIKGPVQYNTVFVEAERSSNPGLVDLLKANGAEFVYKVSSDNKELESLILRTLRKFWTNGLHDALTAIEWGFSCCQVVYRQDKDSKLSYDYLKWYHPDSVNPLMIKHRLIGARLKGITDHENGLDMFFPKILWHIHERSVNPIFGQSRLEWCSIPWHESYVCYGARDIRRTWFIKNAFDGGEMRYPIGKTKVGTTEIDNLVLATQMMGNMRTGGFRVFPDDVNAATGQQKWTYTAPAANITPNGLMEYPKELRYEILEAMGIPPEVTESQNDNGMGSATGRKVPMMIYYSTLAHLCDQVIFDLKSQVLDYLALVNYKSTDFTIERVTLEDAMLPEQAPNEVAPQSDLVTQTEENTNLQV